MQDRPDAAELAEAVREFLEAELLPQISDPRLRFRTLVAMNALGMVSREAREGEALLLEDARELSGLLRGAESEPRPLGEGRRQPLPEPTHEPAPESIPAPTQEPAPGSIPESIPEAISESIPESIPEAIPESIPKGIPEAIPESVHWAVLAQCRALSRTLAERIRRGDAPPGTLGVLKRCAVRKLAVASPKYPGK